MTRIALTIFGEAASKANSRELVIIKGRPASISDQADNVMIVWRNKRKQFDAQAGKPVEESHPDALLICEKQRNGEWEGKIALWFHGPSQQYVERLNGKPQGYAA